MKKLIGATIIGAFLTLSNANAGMITDTVTQNVFLPWFHSMSYTHDINDDGFVLGSALSGNLKVNVHDDASGWDEFLGWETVLFVVESFDFDTGGITFGSSFSKSLGLTALGALNGDGKLDVTVKSIWGDFYVGDSVLTVETADADVPESGTVGLLGLGLVGLAAFRKLRKA